jgi:hypothetical protein
MTTVPPAPPDSLEQFLRYMTENNIDDDRIYAYLCNVNIANLTKTLRRYDRVMNAIRPRTTTAKDWKQKQRNLKGRLFEKLLGVLLGGTRPFTTWSRVQTPTNELDWLVQLGPMAQFVPALRLWGTHFMCECKSEDVYVSVTWVQKLAEIIQNHGASVALLLSMRGLAVKGNAKRAVNAIQLLSVQNKVIVCLDFEDVRQCVTGTNFLRLLSQQYTAARNGVAKLKALTS